MNIADDPKEPTMTAMTLSVTIKCQPGKRNEVKAIWESMTRPHAESNDKVQFSCYSFANEDADTIILFEVLSDSEVLTTLYQEEWFKKYLAAMSPLLAGPPEIVTGTPVWIK